MDKRQSEHIEDRFRQAADHLVPPFNDEAWNKMELLLDKDQKKRRPFIWWWMFALLLLAGGTAGIYYYRGSDAQEGKDMLSQKPVLVQSNSNAKTEPSVEGASGKQEQAITEAPIEQPERKKVDAVPESDRRNPAPASNKPLGQNSSSGYTKKVGDVRAVAGKNLLKKTSVPQKLSRKELGEGAEETWDELKETTQQNSEDATNVKAADIQFAYQHPEFLIRVEMPGSWLNPPHDRLAFKDSLQMAIKTATKKANKQGPAVAKWYFLAAGGVDAANLHKFDTSHRRFVFGADIGYHLNSIFSVQAGFHAGRALYVAGPADYKAKPGTYWSDPTVKIRSVEANCFIFDLPLLIRADVLHNRNRALYATTGFSSSITNREVYNYHYNNSMGYRMWKATYRGNVDWFSYADFSIGFEQKIFKTFYLQLEPYAKLPISGIGEGKVKLYSLGVQLGLKYQPLKQK
ncbi:MAG: hypothetical protein INR73_16275 [Williamsia sp.]|nr:hypothetical protein [Williamsia sp.]